MMDVALLDQLTVQNLERMSTAMDDPETQGIAAELIGRLRSETPAPRFRVVRAPTRPPMPPDEDEDAAEAVSDPGATVIPLAQRRRTS